LRVNLNTVRKCAILLLLLIAIYKFYGIEILSSIRHRLGTQSIVLILLHLRLANLNWFETCCCLHIALLKVVRLRMELLMHQSTLCIFFILLSLRFANLHWLKLDLALLILSLLLNLVLKAQCFGWLSSVLLLVQTNFSLGQILNGIALLLLLLAIHHRTVVLKPIIIILASVPRFVLGLVKIWSTLSLAVVILCPQLVLLQELVRGISHSKVPLILMFQTVIALDGGHNKVLAIIHNTIICVGLAAHHRANVLFVSYFFLLELKLRLLLVGLLRRDHLFRGLIQAGRHRLSILRFSVRLFLRESDLV
jgi:hypothetical protein